MVGIDNINDYYAINLKYGRLSALVYFLYLDVKAKVFTRDVFKEN